MLKFKCVGYNFVLCLHFTAFSFSRQILIRPMRWRGELGSKPVDFSIRRTLTHAPYTITQKYFIYRGANHPCLCAQRIHNVVCLISPPLFDSNAVSELLLVDRSLEIRILLLRNNLKGKKSTTLLIVSDIIQSQRIFQRRLLNA